MIEITCTPTEQKRLIQALETGMANIDDAVCLFPNKAKFCIQNPGDTCPNCLRTKIKWNIKTRKKGP